MANDPYWNNVVLAMRMDDSGLTDVKAHTVTKYGNTTRSATQSKFGGYSAYFDGTGDYLSIPDSEDCELGSGDFTIEAFVYRSSATYGTVVSKAGTVPSTQHSFLLLISAAGAVVAYLSNTGTSSTLALGSSDGVIPVGEFKHLALVRSGSAIDICVDGVSVVSGTFSGAIFNGTANIQIGAYNATATVFFAGYIDELRITKGVARYPGAVPSESLPSTPPQLSGTVKDIAGNLVSRSLRSHRKSDGVVGGATTSSASDGTFLVNAYDASSHYVVCFDDNLDENAIVLDNITPIV